MKLEIREESERTFKLYDYTPSAVPAAIFLALFILITAFQIYQTSRTIMSRATYKEKHVLWIMLPFLLGGVFEIVGYIGRILSKSDTEALGPYIMQSILLLVAPALYTATLYMSLGRLIARLECQKYSIIPLRFLTKIFVFGDVLSFLMQASGGGIMSSGTESSMNTGENIIIGGLIVQLLFFGMFVVVASIFHYRVSRRPNECAMITRNVPSQFNNWNSILIALFCCSILILIRSIFRLIEYVQGNDGYLISHEAFLYCFDATLMFLNMVILSSQNIGDYFVMFKTHKSNNTERDYSIDPIVEKKADFV